jgi:multicomponent K+:H+ antiporter subunit F
MNLAEIAYAIGWIVLLFVCAAGFWRIAKGPTTLDRMVGFDAVMIAMVALIVLFSIHEGTGEYLELVIVVTALGFFGTVSYFYYLSQPRRKIGEDVKKEQP